MTMERERLVIVPTESHVLFFARAGVHAETRRALFRRLAAALLSGADTPAIATRVEAELAASHAHGSPRLARAAERAMDLLVDAHGDTVAAMKVLRKTRLRGLEKGVKQARERLLLRGLFHPRETPARLALAIAETDPVRMVELCGARNVEARFVHDWSASDGAFFRALDAALSRAGGSAAVVLPELDARIDAAREESPHERVAMACARELDAAPRFVTVTVPSTWAISAPAEVVAKTSLIRAADRAAEVSACAALVFDAKERGVPLDEIGIALPLRGGLMEAELARALAEHGLRSSHADPELCDDPTVRRFEKRLREKLPARATRAAYLALCKGEIAESEEAQRGGVGAFGVLATDRTPDALGRTELTALTRAAAAWDALAFADYAAATKRLGIADEELAIGAFLLEARASLPSPRDPATRRVAAVRIGTLTDFVGLPLGLLIVAASNDRGDGAENAVIADPLVRRLLDERRAAHAVSVATCLDTARAVVFSFQARDEDGGELAPAPYVAWLERGGASVLSVGASPLGPGRGAPRDLRLRAFACDHALGRRLVPDAATRAEVELTRERFFLDPSRTASALTGLLRPTPALAHILAAETGAERAISVTAVEHMAQCSFVGFAECVLGAREKAEEERLPSVRDEGTLVHEALARAFNACKIHLSLPPSRRNAEETIALGLAAANAGFAEETPEVIRERVRASVKALLAVAIEDVTYTFQLAEQSFGGHDSPWPAHRITDGDRTLVVRGQIDRVDVSAGSVRVIDYKRRTNAIKKVLRKLGETSLQVPLYACVAARVLGRQKGESGFLPTDPRDLGDAGTTPRGLSDAMARVLADENGLAVIERRALDIVTTIRAGDVRPLPRDPNQCGYCAHDGGCRKPRFTIEHEHEE